MKLKLLSAVGLTAIMMAPSVAFAGDEQGWYLRGNVGYGIHTDMDFDGDIVGDVESEGDIAGSVGVGYAFGNNWRLEADYDYLWTENGQIDSIPGTYAKMETQTLMLNALYDFNDFGRWEPYVGAGIGLARGKIRAVANDFVSEGSYIDSPVCVGDKTWCSVADTDNSLAWQLIAGVGYDITENLTWDTHYTYMDADSFDYDSTKLTVASPTVGTYSNGSVDVDDAGSHTLVTGFRYRFGKSSPMVTCWDGSKVKMIGECPAEPVRTKLCWNNVEIPVADTCPPEPPTTQICWDGSEIGLDAACPAQPTVVCWDNTVVTDAAFCPAEPAPICGNGYRQEIIYYEFDKGQSAETRGAVERILDMGDFCKVDSVRVIGHTDTSGAASYNMSLSKRRAKDARDELIRQGVNANTITSEGKGETEPFVPTGDGVKEPLNRRTEVLIQMSEVSGITTN